MRAVTLLNVLLLVALVGGSVAVYPELPDRIPVHFGSGGAPDRWADTSWGSWFGLPLTTIVVNVLLYGITLLAQRDPRFINIPEKRRFLKLPSERQRVVLARVGNGIEGFALLLTLFFSSIQLSIYRTALGEDTGSLVSAILVLSVIAAPVLAIALMLRIQKEIDRQEELERRAGDVGMRP